MIGLSQCLLNELKLELIPDLQSQVLKAVQCYLFASLNDCCAFDHDAFLCLVDEVELRHEVGVIKLKHIRLSSCLGSL